jgi:hypothetical protein
MKAFYIHDEKKRSDIIVVPEIDSMVPVNRAVMEMFIAVEPDFSGYAGKPLNGLPPETFGKIVATRETDGDVCIIETSLWRGRMACHLGLDTK